ncbi:FAD:protein FMN transferase [Bifidobacterium callitrichos]|uniref:FAD:protein FMN transferase n=1 Tax=Bifidobacterium callitrichos TaxID=762209 RepID=A0A5M9ZAC3_9BIFI|nr:FAD:protein FMN transferase [Bifidobacterium callitrichos]KAA8815335.1 FAD:protein FMN transferase [Bifidobacterium callitrichos]
MAPTSSRPTIRARVIHAMTIPFTIQLVRTGDTGPDNNRIDPITKDSPASHLDTLLDEVTPRIAAFLADVDSTFSPFRDDSQVAAARRGDWSALLHPGPLDGRPVTAFAEIYALAQQAKALTDGHFDPMHAGVYDPTGIVKGWAVEEAHRRFLKPLLDTGRCEAAAIGGGGDIQTGVSNNSCFTWNIGVADPFSPTHDATLRTITLRNGGIATSGTSARGEHITRRAHDLAQVTVVDDRLTFADMWATAAISAGERDFRAMIARNDVARTTISAVLVRADGTVAEITPGTSQTTKRDIKDQS